MDCPRAFWEMLLSWLSIFDNLQFSRCIVMDYRYPNNRCNSGNSCFTSSFTLHFVRSLLRAPGTPEVLPAEQLFPALFLFSRHNSRGGFRQSSRSACRKSWEKTALFLVNLTEWYRTLITLDNLKIRGSKDGYLKCYLQLRALHWLSCLSVCCVAPIQRENNENEKF